MKMKTTFLTLVVFAFTLCSELKAQNTWTIYNSSNANLPSNTLWYVKAMQSDTMIVSTWGAGFFKFLNGNVVETWNITNSSITNNQATAIHYFNGKLYLGTENGGFYVVDGSSMVRYTATNSKIPSNIIYSITNDSTGLIWLATRFGGVCSFNDTTFTTYNTGNSGIGNNINYSVAVDQNNVKWFGSGYNGLSRFDNFVWSNYTTSNSPIPDNDVYSLAVAPDNAIWMGTNGGVARLLGTSWTVYNTSNSGLPANYIRQVKFDAAGNLWVAAYGGGVAKFDGTVWTTFSSTNSNLPSNNVFSLDFDSQGRIWVALYGEGLATMNPTGLSDLQLNAGIHVFPNPSAGIFDLILAGYSGSEPEVRVFDSKGSLVADSQMALSDFGHKCRLDLSHLSDGIYSAVVTHGSKTVYQKMVLSR